MDTNKVKEIKLAPEFEKAVMDLGFSEFTEIQETCIPLIQAGKDVIGLSHTGSGKTAAFGFPSLEKVVPGQGMQVIVLVPTRELCAQVAKEFRKFTKYKRMNIVEVYGGVSINPQITDLRTADVAVGTPGRVLDHIDRNTINFTKVKVGILDEADKMFEMGFIDDVKDIIALVPPESQMLMFSATMSKEVMEIAKNYMNEPEKVKMPIYVDKSKLIQNFYDVQRPDKFSLMMHLIKQERNGLILVFCATRRVVDVVARNINKQRVRAEALHGGLSQNKRNQVMDAFKNGKIDVLVASDVAARGIDVKHVNLVVNYDIPKSSQEYVHRIGRTARAGAEGKVISLLSHEDHENFSKVMEDRDLLIQRVPLPEFEQVRFDKRTFSDRDREGPRGPRRGGPREGGRGGRPGFGKPRDGERRDGRGPSRGGGRGKFQGRR